MKFKIDFITNSSSTAFMITNRSSSIKTIADFVVENPHIIEDFKEDYSYIDEERYNQGLLFESAKRNNITFQPGEEKLCIFGDEQGTLIGHVFDYMLRSGGSSKSFTWRFREYLR